MLIIVYFIEQRKKIELSIPTIDLSLLRKIKGGYLPGSEDDSFGLGELESPICRPLPEEPELPEDPELIEQDEPDNGDNEDNRSEDRDTHNLNSALEYLRSHAYAQYSRENCGHCARAVRSAL